MKVPPFYQNKKETMDMKIKIKSTLMNEEYFIQAGRIFDSNAGEIPSLLIELVEAKSDHIEILESDILKEIPIVDEENPVVEEETTDETVEEETEEIKLKKKSK